MTKELESEMTVDSIKKAFEILKKENPDHFPDTLIQQSKEHWKKHYPELTDDQYNEHDEGRQ